MIMFTLLIDIQAQYLLSEKHLLARRNNTKNLWRRQNKISGESGALVKALGLMYTGGRYRMHCSGDNPMTCDLNRECKAGSNPASPQIKEENDN